MPRVVFTSNLQRHVAVPEREVEAATVAQALSAVFAETPKVRGYVLDEQGHVRKHIAIYIDGRRIADRAHLTDAVGPHSEICVFQALSGGTCRRDPASGKVRPVSFPPTRRPARRHRRPPVYAVRFG